MRLLLVALLLSPAAAQAAPASSPPPAAAVENVLIQRFQQDQAALQSYVHLEHVVTEKDGRLDGRTLRVWYVNHRQVSETIALDDRQLSPAELQAEHQRALQRAREAAQRKAPQPGFLEFDGKTYPFDRLAHDYVYGPARLGVWNGRNVWIYPARPNPDVPSRSRAETLLLKSAGEVWVDAEDVHVVRIQIHTTSTVRYGLGILADIHHASLDLSLHREAPGRWLPTQASFKLDATILLLKHLTRSKQQSFYDFQPVTQPAAVMR